MTDEIVRLLDEIGARMQGPAEAAWMLLVQQQKVHALGPFVGASVLLAIGVLALVGTWRCRVAWHRERAKDHYNSDLEAGLTFMQFLLPAIALGVLIGFPFSVLSGLVRLINPEYYALQEIMQAIGNVVP